MFSDSSHQNISTAGQILPRSEASPGRILRTSWPTWIDPAAKQVHPSQSPKKTSPLTKRQTVFPLHELLLPLGQESCRKSPEQLQALSLKSSDVNIPEVHTHSKTDEDDDREPTWPGKTRFPTEPRNTDTHTGRTSGRNAFCTESEKLEKKLNSGWPRRSETVVFGPREVCFECDSVRFWQPGKGAGWIFVGHVCTRESGKSVRVVLRACQQVHWKK